MSILIYGATGFTGTLVARGLRARSVPLVLSGRDASRLERLAAGLGESGGGAIEVRPAPVHDSAALDRALHGVELVVGCAGPFARVGEPLVAAAVRAGVPYLDIAGEQSFLRAVYERYESPARKRGVLVLSGMALEIAPGDLGAQLVAREAMRARGLAERADGDADDLPAVDEVTVAYALNRFRPTAGTSMAATDSLAGASWVWSGDRWDPLPPLAERRMVNFGPATGERATLSFPSGEVITVPRHVRAGRVQTYISLLDTGPLGDLMTRVATLVSPAVPALFRTALGAQARALIGAEVRAPSDVDRKFATFAVACEARAGFEHARMVLGGADPYGFSAAVACWGAEELLARQRAGSLPAGVRAPAEVFEPGAALDAMAARWHLDVYRSF